jgi:hypothetical protein
MYHLLCFALLMLLVAPTKIRFEEQALVVGTKQQSQAIKVVKHASFVMGLLAFLCPIQPLASSMWIWY